jgi:ribosomal protein S18 acetylase RimI-like enzyme
LSIRACGRADLDAVCQIELKCFGDGHALPRIALTQYFDLFESAFALAEVSSEVVGFAVGGIAFGEGPRAGWLLDAAVLPNFQGRGVGQAICRYALDRLASAGIQKVRATVAPDNERSLSLLRRLGFAELGIVAGYFGPGQPRLLVEWRRGK